MKMGQFYNPYIASFETMCLNMDVANVRSYPGTGNTWSDVSNFNNTGALTSCTLTGSGGTTAFTFNGTTSLVNLGTTNGGNVTTAWTVEAWIYPTGFGEGSSGRIFQHSSGSLTGFIFSLDNTNVTSGIQLNTYAISGFSARIGNCITLNEWQQVALSFSSGTATFYVNGASIGSSSITSPSAYTGSDYIGNNSGATNTFAGNISVVRLYRSALTAGEILNNYDVFKGRYSTSGAGGLEVPQ
jgi:hypothetical protein